MSSFHVEVVECEDDDDDFKMDNKKLHCNSVQVWQITYVHINILIKIILSPLLLHTIIC
jgi:hypothetical protein